MLAALQSLLQPHVSDLEDNIFLQEMFGERSLHSLIKVKTKNHVLKMSLLINPFSFCCCQLHKPDVYQYTESFQFFVHTYYQTSDLFHQWKIIQLANLPLYCLLCLCKISIKYNPVSKNIGTLCKT